MHDDRTAVTKGEISNPSSSLPWLVRRRVFLYLGTLVIVLTSGSPSGGLIDIPISFILKNKLHLQVHELADFRLLCAIPLYLSFVFGFIRDIWNPFGMADRGYLILFGLVSTGLYIVFAFSPVSYSILLVAMLLLTTSFLFVASAQNALTSAIGQRHVMSGQISAVWNISASIPTIGGLLIGGALSGLLEQLAVHQAVQMLFLIGAGVMASVMFCAIWAPSDVFDNAESGSKSTKHALEDLKKFVRHWPIYPALLIWLLWNFAPGSVTPLQYYLQNTLHAEDIRWGQWNAIFSASFVPTFMLFGLLCGKFPLRTLLLWGTLVATPQFVPLLFAQSVTEVLLAAIPIGLMGGIATAAYLDLIIRSCPKGLEGTTLMMSGSLYFIASRFGDVLGTKLYTYYGDFTACVIAITAVYFLILPTLLLVPKQLIASADGQAPELTLDTN